MFNLIISGDLRSWEGRYYELERARVAIEYTANEISERYKFLNERAISELKSFPTLFVVENEQVESKIGYITEIRILSNNVVIQFEIDPILPTLPIGAIESLRFDIDLGRWELSRTHWAIKDEPIFEVLVRNKFLTVEQVEAFQARRVPSDALLPATPTHASGANNLQVFIVHGHDELAKLDLAEFISSIGLEPIILHMQASSGRTIIEKIEHYSNVGFGVVLYTPCDIGAKAGELNSAYRARQNVVFEHGYLIARLGRSKVTALVKDKVETPNDISGVVYVAMDDGGKWKEDLKIELRSAGYPV